MSKSLSPLRYPGGKSKLVPRIAPYTENFNCFIEPFAGGASISLNLLMSDMVEKIILNDSDQGIYSFWKAILTETDAFIDKMYNTKITPAEWKRQKNIYLSESHYSLQLGFATFFLNRVCRSGILTAGIIGGNEQSGNYKMDCRFNKPVLEKQIKNIALHKNQIEIYGLDIHDFLKHIPDKNGLIYLDPPYYNKGHELYRQFFHPEDHEQLRISLENYIKNPWLITYDNAPQIKEIYYNYTIKEIELSYSIQSKRKETELLILSNNLKDQ